MNSKYLLVIVAVTFLFGSDGPVLSQPSKDSDWRKATGGWINDEGETAPPSTRPDLSPPLSQKELDRVTTNGSQSDKFGEYYKMAQELDGKKQWLAARDYYSLALKQKPQLTTTDYRVPLALCRLESICRTLGMANDAENCRKMLIRLGGWKNDGVGSAREILSPAEVEIRLFAADALAFKGDSKTAEEIYRGISKAQFTNEIDSFIQAMIAERLVRLFLAEHQLKQACNELERPSVLAKAAYDAEVCAFTARTLLCILSAETCVAMYENRVEEADKKSQECLALLSKIGSDSQYRKFRVYSDRGELLSLKGDITNAVNYFNRALTAANYRKPLSMAIQAPVRLKLATCYRKQGKISKAEELEKECSEQGR